MSKVPDISIIIVTYNAANTLQKCLDSIFKQSYPDVKIILIDGGSTDATLTIIKANENNIYYWQSEPDNGIYDAMNKALPHITTDWVYFLGADDELYLDFSAFAIELKDQSIIYYANVKTKDVIRSGKLNAYQIAKHGIFHQAIIYPSSVFDKYQYQTKYKIYADAVLSMELWKDKNYHFVYGDYVIAHFNHSGLSGTGFDNNFNQDKSSLIKANFGWLIWFRYKVRRLKNRN